MEEIKGKNLLEVLEKTEMPLIKVLSAMEVKGIKIDPVYFPPVGASNPLINLIKVVFPLPFGPRRPIILPDSKERVILSSACLRPYFLDRFLHSRIVLIFDSPFRVFQVK